MSLERNNDALKKEDDLELFVELVGDFLTQKRDIQKLRNQMQGIYDNKQYRSLLNDHEQLIKKNNLLYQEILTRFYQLNDADTKSAYKTLQAYQSQYESCGKLLEDITAEMERAYRTLKISIEKYKEKTDPNINRLSSIMNWSFYGRTRKKEAAHGKISAAHSKIIDGMEETEVGQRQRNTAKKSCVDYKESIKKTIKFLNQNSGEGSKTNIEIIAQDKSPKAMQVLKAVLTVASVLSIVGIFPVAYLLYDAHKHKGGAHKLLASEGQTVKVKMEKIERQFTPKKN